MVRMWYWDQVDTWGLVCMTAVVNKETLYVTAVEFDGLRCLLTLIDAHYYKDFRHPTHAILGQPFRLQMEKNYRNAMEQRERLGPLEEFEHMGVHTDVIGGPIPKWVMDDQGSIRYSRPVRVPPVGYSKPTFPGTTSTVMPRMKHPPSNPKTGEAFYSTTHNEAFVWNGSAWIPC